MAKKFPNPDTQFSPGKSGNPNGRPVGSGYKAMVQSNFAELINKEMENGKSFISNWLEKFVKTAMKDEHSYAFRYLSELMLDPKILDQIDALANKSQKADADFMRYRVSLLAHDIQQDILKSKERMLLLMAGRRSGKTEGNVLQIMDINMAKDDSKVLLLSQTFEATATLYWDKIINGFESIGIKITEKRRTDGFIRTEKNGTIEIKGTATVDDREKLRGGNYDLIIVDEVQSIKALPYLLQDILEPMLLDRKGKILLSGTGPRVRGTYWERIWETHKTAKRFNWSLEQNPFIPDRELVIDKICQDKGLTRESPLIVREYLGKIAYDDDALVFRLGENNYYETAELAEWIRRQPVTDIRFTAGLDYGWTDSDGFVIICYSTSRPERWVVYEHKSNRTGITELADKIKAGLDYVKSSDTFAPAQNKHIYIYADTNEGKVSFELSTMYGLPVQDAYKQQKDLAVELLQDEVRQGLFKVPKGGIIDDECLKTVFGRNANDELTRVIDDDTFHPDALDAVLYSMRPVWMFGNKGTK